MRPLFIALLFLTFAISANAQTPLYPSPYTVGTLPAAATMKNRVVDVTDAVAPGDCTTGGGTYKTPCISDGSTWGPWGALGSGTGTVTDVHATSPLHSSGGSAPTITIDTASGSQTGALSSTDWNTFNGKQDALGFTPVPNTRTVNGHALSSNVTVTPSDLSLVIGTNTEAWDADLDAIAAISGTSGLLKKTAANTWSLDTNSYTVTARNIGTTSPITGGGDLSADRTIACATCVVASSPGAGIAHFAGSTQTVTSAPIVNADVGSSAAIAYSKLNLTGSILNADLAGSIAFSKLLGTDRVLTAGAGLTGGGDLSADRTFNIGAGNGITVNADDVALTTPGTLTVSSSNSASGNHTHAITSSSNPGAAASILASSGPGYLQLVRLGLGMSPTNTLDVTGTAGVTSTVTVGADVLPSINYTSNLGALATKYLTVHAAELWVETLVAQNTVATIGGRVLVAPTTPLTADIGTGATTITVKYNNLNSGDRIYLESNGKVEFMAVTSAAGGSAGAYTYSVTRNLDGSGANQWYAGDAVLNTGTTGNGFIDLYSVSGVIPGSTAGPTIVGNVRTGTTYNNIEPRWAIGNLNGLYGYSGSTYGAAFGTPTAAWLKIDPTNGVRIGFNGTTLTQIDASGNASFAGSITASGGTIGGLHIASNKIYAGAGNFQSTDTAFYLDVDGDFSLTNRLSWNGTSLVIGGLNVTSNKFYAGAGNFNNSDTAFYLDADGSFSLKDKLSWNGTSLTINGAITSTSGTIGGFTIGSTSLLAGSGSTTVAMDSGGTNPAFYAGSATPGSAPFRVTNAGALTATNATVTGAFTLNSGSVAGDLNIGTGGDVRSGATAFLTGNGYWLDYNAGTPRLRVGTVAAGLLTKGISWDGTTFSIIGDSFSTQTLTAQYDTKAVSTDGLILATTSIGDATHLESRSPRLRFLSKYYKIATTSDITTEFTQELIPTSAAGSSVLTWKYALQGGSFSTVATLDESGNFVPIGSIGSTGSRVVKGWFTDLQVTNAIAGSITGNAATATDTASKTGTGSTYVTSASPTITTATNSGQFTIAGSGSAGKLLELNNTGTGFQYSRLVNTGGELWLGLEGSGGGDLIGGTAGYGAVFGTVVSKKLYLVTNSAIRMTFDTDGSVVVGSPTGGPKGAGTINAQAVYDDNVLLTDWVLTPGGKPDLFAPYRRLFALDEARRIAESEHRLPWMPTASEFESARSLGGMTTRLWQGQEQQQLYIQELEDRIKRLEANVTRAHP